ncbi:MAG: AarF/ABC1/UbiB kinase family protein [Acidimicrobiales bacterium]|nr:AarF/ABC1/UbiB kinase family protein [Acidimicrobiales bacterium]
MLAAVLTFLLTLPVIAVIALVASRLLGVRRSWVAVVVSGVLGYLIGHGVALAAADGDATAPGYVRNVLVVALLATMTVAVAIDLMARPGSLARGDRAGLFVLPRPVADVRAKLQPLGRSREVLAVARANGFGPQLGIRRRSGEAEAEVTPVRVRLTLEQCGGMFVKLGQVLSTRTDLLPPEYCVELAKLQSGVAPAPEADMRALLERELGRPTEEVFAEFDWTPIAAASIAHAYRARLADGELDVIVKVQRPGVDVLVQRDAAVVLRLARLAQERTPWGRDLQVLDQAEEFVDGLRQELDFRIEGRNAAGIAPVAALDRVRVPATVTELTTRRVLVQERLVGRSVAEQSRFEELGVDRGALADRLIASMLRQMLDHGHYHADPHPGNVFLLDDGGLGLLDWGATGRLDPLQQSAILQIMLGAGIGDTGVLRQGVESIAVLPPDLSPDDLERALHQFLVSNVAPGAGVSASALNDLLKILTRFQIRVPREMTSLVRALVTVEGTLTVIEPGYSLADAAQRLAKERLQLPEQPDPTAQPEELVQRELVQMLPVLRQLPNRIDRISSLAERGELRTKVSLLGTEDDRRAATLLVNRLVLGLLSSGVAVASALLLAADGGVTFAGDTQVTELLGYVGLVGSGVLGLRLVAAIVRDGLN